MKLPIPEDWDGESWACYQIQWPESVAYRGLLMGFLSYLTRGRTYDEETGNIKAAQAIGWDIFNHNLDLIPCAKDQPPTPPPPIDQWAPECAFDGLGELFEESEDCMPGVLDIKIDGGKLWKRMSPCCEWFEVGSLTGITEDIGPTPLVPEGEDPPEYSACGKAWAVVDTIYAVADSCWDQRDNLPWDYWPNVKARHPGLNLSAIPVINAILVAIKIDLLFEESDLFDASTRQTILCRVVNLFEDDAEGIDDDAYSTIRAIFRSEWGIDPFFRSFWDDVITAIGPGDLNNIAKLAASDTTRDCACPEIIVDPRPNWPENDWAYWVDIKHNGLPAWATLGGDSEYVAGQGVKETPGVSGLMNPEVLATLNVGADTVFTVGYMKWRVIWPGSDYQGNNTVCRSLSYDEHVWRGTYDPDTDPSAGGTFTKTRVVVLDPTNGEHTWSWGLEVNTLNGADETRLVYLEEIGLAGTGTDPFV